MENCNNEMMFSFSTTSKATLDATSAPTATQTPSANSSEMSQHSGCLAPLPIQTPIITYEFEQPHQQTNYTATTSTTGNDPFATYTDNFDLSLLPQDYNNTITTTTTPVTTNLTQTNLTDKSIPATVCSFDVANPHKQDTANSSAVPNIKIEQTWSSCPALNTIKQEQIYQNYFPLNTKQNRLQPPPPAYPAHIYPSPQSSPAQSEYNFSLTQYSSSPSSSTNCYESLNSSRNSLFNAVSSPCPSIDVHTIKQEQLHILPPSPPESNCDTPTPQSIHSSCSSGFDFKLEPSDSDAETFNDCKKTNGSATTEITGGYQLLREYLADTTFQKRNNLKSLALESFFGGLEEVHDNFEPVISLALEHAKREADATCAKLQISQDPSAWSAHQVHAWLRSTLQQYQLPLIDDIENKFKETGAELLQLTEDEFAKRIPECGSTLHAQLEIWKLTYSPENSKNNNDNQVSQSYNIWTQSITNTDSNHMEEDTEGENDFLTNLNPVNNSSVQQSTSLPVIEQFVHSNEVVNANSNGLLNVSNNLINNNEVNNIVPVKRAGTRNGGSHIHLWQFLKELLAAPHINGTAIRWIDRSKGIFKIEDSVRVAKLWGKRKNRPAMNYDKLSRSIRQYYKKGIMKKTERSQRLVYQFCQPYHM